MTWQKYFSYTELACRCCGRTKVADSFLDKLLELREAWGRPMIVTSCCRCQRHNDTVGGKQNSFHLFDCPQKTGLDGTIAIDISTTNLSGADKWALVRLAISKGWSVGVARTFLHFDRRSDFTQTGWAKPVLFTY